MALKRRQLDVLIDLGGVDRKKSIKHVGLIRKIYCIKFVALSTHVIVFINRFEIGAILDQAGPNLSDMDRTIFVFQL